MNIPITVFLDIEDSVFSWIFSHIPIIATCMTLLVIAVWATYRFTRWVGGYTTRFKHVELDVGTLKENMLVVNTRLDGIDVKLKVMNTKFKRKFNVVETKLDALDKKYDTLDKKFDMLLNQLAFNNQRIKE